MNKNEIKDICFRFGFDAKYDGSKGRYFLEPRSDKANTEAVKANLNLHQIPFKIISPFRRRVSV